MRSPKRKRPRRRMPMDAPSGIDLAEVAKKVRYIGSPEHKDMPSFAGHPRPRADASICERSLSRSPENLTRTLRECIRIGRVGGPWEGDFPRYVWGQIAGTMYEARLVNRETGEYKGYPLEAAEWPNGV